MLRSRILAPIFAPTLALSLTASAAAAQDLDLTPLIQSGGLAGAEAALTGDDPATAFALGGVRFLGAVERALQLRYRHNAQFDDLDIPVLRLPIPPNPEAEPFYPGLITDLFRAIDDQMTGARTALEGAEGDFGVTLDVASLWFDINENGVRDSGEGVLSVAGATVGAPLPDEAPSLVVRFDTADAAWLRAYTHLLAGVANLVIAFDPTDVITDVGGSIATMNGLRGDDDGRTLFFSSDDEFFVDMVAMVYGAVNQQPNAENTRATRAHWLAMVAENRRFWQMVAQEADNDREWIPNATQSSAMGFELPPDTGATWLAVLSDAEAVLNGELLVGHWRVSPGAGVNVAKLMENPVPVDIVTWFHGHGLVEYMERGTLVDSGSLRRFEQLVGGDAVAFAIILN